MRFVFGLIAGALVTLFVAAAFDVPADRLVGKVVHTTARLTENVAALTPALTSSSSAQAEAGELTVATPAAEAPDVEIAEAASLDAQAVPEPSEFVASAGEVEEVFLPEPLEIVEMTATSQVTDVVPGALESSSSALPAVPENITAQEATAWGPFHSEASARGFARRLSREAGRPFNVDKRGPGNYLVTFAYTDTADLNAVKAQITQVTGIPQS